MTPGKAEHVVEAALFSAGRPLSVEEIAEETGLSKKAVTKTVKELQKTYKERDTALEVGPAGTKWAMQVRTQVADDAAKFAPMEIPKKVLKTLALIAYHQPLKQSELVDMIGSKTYEHVGELRERGLVLARKDGVTKSLTTTQSFPEYFGLEAGDTEGVRAAMAKLVGLPPPEPKKKEKDLQSFEGPASDEGEEAPPEGGEDAAEAVDATTDGENPPQDDAKPEAVPEATEDPQTA